MGLNYLASLSHYVPELIACVTMLALILIESSYEDGETKRPLLYGSGILGLFVVFISLCLKLNEAPTGIFTNAVVIDPFSSFAKIIMTLGALAALYLAKESKDIYEDLKGEYAIISIGVLVGGMLLVSANNFLILYLGIETLSILSYVMASLKKKDEKSSEAGLKYALYGGISAGIMLFGMSHIFGVLGTISFTEMAPKIASLNETQVAIMLPSFLLFFAGLGYKIAAVPFHMWSPDVYEGSPIPVTAFFSIVPKIAGVAALVRVSYVFFGTPGPLNIGWVGILTIIAALTMTIGNVAAINQQSVKRMLAYSSISHAGVMLLGVLVINEVGTRAILFYAVAYLFMTVVAFYIVSFVQDTYGNDHFERFNGLIYRYPFMAVMMALVMFSLAGIPPLSGFVAKFHILSAIIAEKHYTLAIVAGINSVISLYYYLKIVRLMIFKPVEAEDNIVGFGALNQGLVVVLAVPVLLLGVFWSKIMILANGAKIFIQ